MTEPHRITIADRIRFLASKGSTRSEIRKTLDCDRQQVAQALKAGPRGRPRKHPACTHCGGTGCEPIATAADATS
jgi:phosphopantetheinyl transferase